ncbi:MAG: hypothetical protein WCH60_08600 [Burkholderiales bacterium]
MMKTLCNRMLACASIAALSSTLFIAPQVAYAGNTTSQGGGVKCYWVLVSSDPTIGSSVYTRVCRKGGA